MRAAGGAERVADRDRAAVDVDACSGSSSFHSPRQASDCAANASLSSTASTSPQPMPGALERAVGRLDGADAEDVGVDGEGAAAGDPGERRRAGASARPPRSRSARAAAPSLSGEALPAVTVPSLTEGGLELGELLERAVGADALVAGQVRVGHRRRPSRRRSRRPTRRPRAGGCAARTRPAPRA